MVTPCQDQYQTNSPTSRKSPQTDATPSWVSGREWTPEELHCVFYTTRFGRKLMLYCYDTAEE